MEFISSLLNTAMENVLGVLLPDPNGACALLPRLMDELDELKHLKSIDLLDFPGSKMSCTPLERCTWMKKIYEDRPIGQIVWPATHNSATNKSGINFVTRPFGQHQTLSIYYQLRNGVRALDIRVQQDGRVCNGNFLSYSMTDVIKDINKFMSETQYEIIILEIQTERGYTDPPDFESYLVHELGDLLIKQDDHVFSKTISQVLPRRIICIWKPKICPRRSEGGPIWSASYMRGDEFETELPRTKFKANLINLSQQIPASERNYFYKVEHIITPHASSVVEWMLVWPRHAKVVSKRINEFARLFLSSCNSQHILDRLQIYSTDFINDDFIVACIALNHSMDIKEYNEPMEMIMRKHMQDLEELEKKFEDEKVLEAQHAARTREVQMYEIRDQQNKISLEKEHLQMMMEKQRQDLEEKDEKVLVAHQAARTREAQIYEIRDQQNKNALEKEHLQMMMQKNRQDFEEKVKNLEVQLETTKLKSTEDILQAVSKEKNRVTQIQAELEELRKEFEDEKVQMEATKNSILIENETLMGELGDARKHLENMLEIRAKQDRDALVQAQKLHDVRMAERRAQLEKDEAARSSEAQMQELRDQLRQSKKALEDANIKHAVDLAKILPEYSKETFATSDHHLLVDGGKFALWLDELSGKKCYMIAAASQHSARPDLDLYIRGEIRKSILSPKTFYVAYLVFKYPTNHRYSIFTTAITSLGTSTQTVYLHGNVQRKDGWLEIELGGYFNEGGGQNDEKLMMSVEYKYRYKSELIVHGIEIRPDLLRSFLESNGI